MRINKCMTTNEYLTTTNFSLTIAGAEFKNLTLAVSGFEHPGVTNRPVNQSARKVDIAHAGTKVVFDPLSITIHLDHELEIYDKLYEWLLNCDGENETKDIALTVYTNSGKPTKTFVYHDAFPSGLGKLKFDSTDSNDSYITLDATFEYSVFDTKKT